MSTCIICIAIIGEEFSRYWSNIQTGYWIVLWNIYDTNIINKGVLATKPAYPTWYMIWPREAKDHNHRPRDLCMKVRSFKAYSQKLIVWTRVVRSKPEILWTKSGNLKHFRNLVVTGQVTGSLLSCRSLVWISGVSHLLHYCGRPRRTVMKCY